MKHLKIYEKFDIINPPENWKVGDIVVAVRGTKLSNDWTNAITNTPIKNPPLAFFSNRGDLVIDRKYEIIGIEDTTTFGQTPERFPIAIKDEDSIIVKGMKGRGKNIYYLKDNFISLEDWEFRQDTKKYNL